MAHTALGTQNPPIGDDRAGFHYSVDFGRLRCPFLRAFLCETDRSTLQGYATLSNILRVSRLKERSYQPSPDNNRLSIRNRLRT